MCKSTFWVHWTAQSIRILIFHSFFSIWKFDGTGLQVMLLAFFAFSLVNLRGPESPLLLHHYPIAEAGFWSDVFERELSENSTGRWSWENGIWPLIFLPILNHISITFYRRTSALSDGILNSRRRSLWHLQNCFFHIPYQIEFTHQMMSDTIDIILLYISSS